MDRRCCSQTPPIKGEMYAHLSDPVHSSGTPDIRDLIKDPDHLKLYMTVSLYSSLVL